jgi:hypothetical protein
MLSSCSSVIQNIFDTLLFKNNQPSTLHPRRIDATDAAARCAQHIVHTTWFVRCTLPYVLCSSIIGSWCWYVCASDTAGAERNEHTISKSSARPNYAWYVSTCWSYVAPENMSSTIHMHLRGSERGSRKHVGVMYIWYTLFLPMSPTTHQYTLHSCIILDTAAPTITPNHGGLVSKQAKHSR